MKEREGEVPFLESFHILLNASGTKTVLFKIDVQLTVVFIEDFRKPLVVQSERIDAGRGKICRIYFVVDVVAQIVEGLFRLGILVDEAFLHGLAA